MNMNLSTKESELLKDLKSHEQLCIDQYTSFANQAKNEQLKSLFNSIADTERSHLATVNELMSGKAPTVPSNIGNSNNDYCGATNYSDEQCKTEDCKLLKNMLAIEKQVSSVYDTAVFEFKNPQARKALNHIQAEEQQHGEQLYSFMSNNGMYN